MRPLKLKMAAFGPYLKPVELDFEKNLRGEKIFLINGTTGAGKTTILDAICFALYGATSGDERDGVMMRSKGISSNIKTEVEFTFSLEEKIYNVNRTLSHHPNRKTNQNQISAELKRDGEIIETQPTRVTNAVMELLGFKVNQFRQVVLLPQGEFKTFLTAKSDERQPILNALFNAELYKKIEDALKDKSDAAQKIFDDLQEKKATLETQADGAKTEAAALEKLRADFFAAQKKSAELKNISDEIQNALTAGKILAKDFVALESAKKSLAAAENNLKKAEEIFSDAKTEYDSCKAQESQRDKLKSDVEELAKVKKLIDELDAGKKPLDDAEKNLQTVNDALGKLEEDARKFDKRLLQLKTRRDELAGAEKNLAEAKIILEKVNEHEKILRHISKLERELAMARQKVSIADKNFRDANLELECLQKLQRDGSAALLAKNLKDGEPCPVCGSKVHCHVDFSDALIPSDKEIEDARAEVERRKKSLDDEKSSADSISGQLLNQRDNLKKFSDLPAADTAKKNSAAAQKDADELADCEKRIKIGEGCIEKNNSALKDARGKQSAASNEHAKLLGEWQRIQSQIPKNYLDDKQKLDDDIYAAQKKLRELENAWKNADKNFRKAGNEKSSCEGILAAAKKSFDDLDSKLKNKKPPDIDELEIRAGEAQKIFEAAIREETSLKNNLDSLEKLSAQLAELEEKISAAEKNLRVWKKLSDAAGGKILGNKISFARYYLGARFEQVLTEANYRLAKMSDRRYWFRQKDEGKVKNSTAGLNLEIFDEHTGEARPVETLSGGESFLASLSLALGLAAVVRNNLGGVKLDTIFIDEGFGSLDSETLDDAISTIMEQSGGRLVGIISHVEELKNQIPVRLEVKSDKTGSEAKFVS